MFDLTHLPLVPHICISEPGQHWFRWWLVACSAPSNYLNQCWFIVNWTPGWNFIIFIQENAYEIVVCHDGGHFVQGEINESWTKWPTFCRQYFQINFHDWQYLIFHLKFTDLSPKRSDWLLVNIGSDNGMVPNRQRDIKWYQLHWCTHASICLNELRCSELLFWLYIVTTTNQQGTDSISHKTSDLKISHTKVSKQIRI